MKTWIAGGAGLSVLFTWAFATAAGPTAADVDRVAALYRQERQKSESSGAAARFPAAWLERADHYAQQAQAAKEAGLFDEALSFYRDARWHLPALPLNLPPNVGRIFGDPRLKHGGFVRSIAYSPDGTRLASASRDGAVRIWDLGSGREVLRFRDHEPNDVKAVIFSPDGKTIASAAANVIKIWDPATGQVSKTLSGHTGYVNCLAFRPDGARLASGGDDRTVRLWDLATGKESMNFGAQNALIYGVAFSPNGKLLASTNGEGRLNVYAPDNSSRRQPLGLDAHNGAAYAVAFSPDGKSIATCGIDRKVVIFGAPGADGEPIEGTGTKKREFLGFGAPVTALAISRDGKWLAAGSRDFAIRLWNFPTAQLARTFLGHTEEVTTLAFAPDGRQLASGSNDQSVKLWDLDPAEAHRTLRGHQGPVWSAAISADGRRIASGGADRILRIWDAFSGKELKALAGHTQAITAVAFQPGGNLVASASGDQTIRLWDVDAGRTVKTLEGHAGPVHALAFSPDGATLLSGGSDHSARLWDVSAGQVRYVFADQPAIVAAVAIRSDGAQAASGCTDGTVKLWNLADGKEETSFRAHETGGVAALAYSPDGQRLATCGADKQARIWNLNARPIKDPLLRLQGHAGPLVALAFSPNGQFLATGGSDHVIKVWNIQNRNEVRSFNGHRDWITSLAFAADGRSVVSASIDQSILVWRFVADETETAAGHARRVTAVAVSANGKVFASASDDRTIRLWDPSKGVESRTLAAHSAPTVAIALSPDGTLIATAGQDRKLRLWDIATGRELRSHDSSDELLLLSFTSDGKKLLAWQRPTSRNDDESADTVQTYDPETLKPIASLADHGRRVSCLALTPDGAMVALGSSDGSVRIWDLPKKERIGGDRPMHSGAVWDVTITPDKKLLIAADKEGAIKAVSIDKSSEPRTWHTAGHNLSGLLMSPNGRLATYGDRGVELWDVATGQSLRSWSLNGVRCLAFTPDNRHILIGLDNSTMCLLDLP